MRSIEIISIPVADQERSKAFYMKLGFQLVAEAPMGNNQNWVQLGLPDQHTCISLVSWWPNKKLEMTPGSLHGIMFDSDNIEEDTLKMRINGIETAKIDNTPWGKYTHFTDPDGNILILHQNP
ncbi:MAG TPA: VOC family protein [Puia sp.]|nr:VOC family protein [Puia sp.]